MGMLHEAIITGTVCVFFVVVVVVVVVLLLLLVLGIFWDIKGGVVFRGEVHVDGTLAALQEELETLKT